MAEGGGGGAVVANPSWQWARGWLQPVPVTSPSQDHHTETTIYWPLVLQEAQTITRNLLKMYFCWWQFILHRSPNGKSTIWYFKHKINDQNNVTSYSFPFFNLSNLSWFQVVPSILPSAPDMSAPGSAAVGSLGHTSGLQSKQWDTQTLLWRHQGKFE